MTPIPRAACLLVAAVLAVAACASAGAPAASDVSSAASVPPAASQGLPATAVAAGSAIPLTTRTPSASDAQFADAAARAALATLGAPALYVGVWDPQRGFFVHAYGQAVRGGADATTEDSFRIASVTKTFVATIILQLVAEQKIALDADMTTYLPEPLAGEGKLHGITVDELLGMRSGLPDYLIDPNGIAAAIGADPTHVWTEQDLVEAALKLDDFAAPGTGGYTNTNFVLLGLIAEHVTGQSLASLIADRLTGPLGLRHTMLPPATDTSLPEPAAHGYLNEACIAKVGAAGATGIDPNTDTTSWNTSYFQGAGGMISTIGDLGAWAGTNLGTDLLPASVAQQRLDVQDIGAGGFLYGLGIKRFGAWYGHDGDAFGWDSLALHNPSTGVTFVAAANACTGLTDNFLALLNTLYPDQPTQ